MMHLDSLTGGRQFMNMANMVRFPALLKISSSLCNPHEQRLCDLMRYTLCVLKSTERLTSKDVEKVTEMTRTQWTSAISQLLFPDDMPVCEEQVQA